MPATMTTLTEVLKERYEGRLNKSLNDDVKTLRRIEKTSKGVVTSELGGKYAVFAVHTRRNSGIGARNEGEALPSPGQQGTTSGRVGLKYQYGAIELNGQVFELANTAPQSFIDAVDLEVDGIKTDLAKDLNRQVYGDGSGTIATATATTTAGNTFTAANVQYVQLDEMVDLCSSAGVVIAADRKVTAINETTGVVTLDGATFNVAIGDILTRTSSYGKEWTGLGLIVSDTGTLYNIDPTVEPVWKAEINDNGGVNRALSELMMVSMYTRIRKRGGKTTAIFTTPGVWNSYFALLTQQRQFVNTKEFTGGFSGLAFTTETGEIPVVQDFDAPPNTMHFLNEDEIQLRRTHDWQFMNRDGSMWQRKIDASGRYDAYEATLYQYSELSTKRRNTHGKITDLTEVE